MKEEFNKAILFKRAILEKKKIKIKFIPASGDERERFCIPFDIGPSRKYQQPNLRYHMYDLNSPKGPHNLSILPEKITYIELLDEEFDPGTYIKWKPEWLFPRDWGLYS